MRPYNWEVQVSIQQQVAPRVSVYAGYSRRWFGNLSATQNRAVTNASYTPYCITRSDGAVDHRRSRCRTAAASSAATSTSSVRRRANNLIQIGQQLRQGRGRVRRLSTSTPTRGWARALLVTGGVSIGRERVNNCDLKDNLSPITAVGVGAVTAAASATPRRATTAYCDVHPPFQPNVKGQITYPFPWGIGGSLSFQSLPGAQINANYPLTNTTPGLTLGRTFSSVAPIGQHRGAGHAVSRSDLPDRHPVHEDLPVPRDDDSSDHLGLQPVQREPDEHEQRVHTTTYGAAWLAPTVILTPRFVDFGVQIDF